MPCADRCERARLRCRLAFRIRHVIHVHEFAPALKHLDLYSNLLVKLVDLEIDYLLIDLDDCNMH